MKDKQQKLYPVYCVKCGRYLATVMADAEVLCCGRWHIAKVLERQDNGEDK